MRFARILAPVALLALAATPLLADWATEKKAFETSIRSQDPECRVAAIAALKDFDHVEGARLLLARFINEKNDAVLTALSGRICDLGDPDAREEVRRVVLGETDPYRRARFCRIYAGGRGLDRVEILRKLLADKDPDVRTAALATLGAPDGLLTRHVAALAKDQTREVRKAAIGALSRIATFDCVEPLIVVVENDPDKNLRDMAVASLSRITDRNYKSNTTEWREWWLKHRVADMSQVDQAISLGADYLRKSLKVALTPPDPTQPRVMGGDLRAAPLMTYALIHTAIDRSDPTMKDGIDWLLKMKSDGTYNMAISALALADLDADKYADRLATLAQTLCDQQCMNGQWGYGQAIVDAPVSSRKGTVPGAAPPVESGPEGGETKAPKRRIPISGKGGSRTLAGDNSNTQFAILGLRAATEAGCEIPKQVWEKSLEWFQKGQQNYSGWDYQDGKAPYWAMTCCGLTSVTICLHALGKDEAFRNGKPLDLIQVKGGVNWLDRNWMRLDDRENATRGCGGWGFYYDLYSLERVGMIVGLDKIGDHNWYDLGCAALLSNQQKDGCWGGNPIDTAFAILFLKRATRGYAVSPQDEK
ncbi:MAG: hypothetical protein K8T20_07165 [Planctomycetes bacterium]|nr:hypothetical protein [Planctomycetota bacterium]